MRDGNIVDEPKPDGATGPTPTSALASASPSRSDVRNGSRKKKPGILSELRFFRRTTEMALRSLHRNVMRSVLTTLGIIIGVGSLISIAEIGKGSSTAIKQVLVTTGANSLLVQAGAASNNGVSLGSGTIKTLTPEDAEAIINECPAVDSLAPIVVARRQVVNGNRNWVPIYIYGTTPGFLRVREWERLAEERRSPPRTSATSPWSAYSVRRSSTNSSEASPPWARRSSSTTSPPRDRRLEP